MFALGTVGRCLNKAVADGQRLSEGCRTLVLIVAPKDARALVDGARGSVDAVTARVAEMARKAGLSGALVDQQRGGGLAAITLTGWAAVAAVASLAVVLVAGSGFAAWRWLGRRRAQHRYVPVTKPADA